MSALRVLVVDDASVYRKIVRNLLATIPGVEVVGVASTGTMALQAIESLKPDLVTLDIEMPELDGLAVLAELKRRKLPAGVIMLSSLSSRGADMTMKALRAGAFDFVPKPSTANLQLSVAELQTNLVPKIEAFRKSRSPVSRNVEWAPCPSDERDEYDGQAAHPATRIRLPRKDRLETLDRVDVVVMGVSTGGPSTLANLLPRLPADFPVPIVVVQHMPPIFTKSLAMDLDRTCSLGVREAVDGDAITAGRVFIAPGGLQTRLQREVGGPVLRITDDPPEKSCKPSVDYLFRSASEVFGKRTLAVVLTGMGDDGMLGCRAIKQVGGFVIAQDETSCVVFGMPRAVIENGLVDVVAPLSEMPPQIMRFAESRHFACR